MSCLRRSAWFALLSFVIVVLPAQIGVISAGIQAEEKTHAKSGEAKTGEKKSEAHDDHAKGVPLNWKEDLAIWSLVVFLVFVLVLWKFAWGPLSSALDKREAKIADDIATAEQGRKDVERMVAEHRAQLDAVQDEVREILAEARRDAEHAKNEIVAAAQREAEETKNRSITEIERAKGAALKELFDKVSEQVAAATEHILGRALEDADRERLIDEALSQLSQN
ncbi:MAG: hypothetical protein Tsb009_15120 [Planctomycetaceae bacterium]